MKKNKKKRLQTCILILLILAGLSLMLYPSVSDWFNRRHQSRAIYDYKQIVKGLSEEERNVLWEAAAAYNRKLYAMYCGDMEITTEELQAEYPTLLNLYHNGMMGVIEIPSINVKLPIMHGTEDSVLQDAIGHVDTSSLPVGGENTHCVLSGHTGLPSARLFTDLEELQVGDEFILEVLSVRMTYVVDQIQVVLPWEAEALEIASQKDYCSLITCTPYGVNSHRLVVRGVRAGTEIVENEISGIGTLQPHTQTEDESRWLYDERTPFILLAGISILIGLMLIVSALLRKRKLKKRAAAQAQSENPTNKQATPEQEGSEQAPQPETPERVDSPDVENAEDTSEGTDSL